MTGAADFVTCCDPTTVTDNDSLERVLKSVHVLEPIQSHVEHELLLGKLPRIDYSASLTLTESIPLYHPFDHSLWDLVLKQHSDVQVQVVLSSSSSLQEQQHGGDERNLMLDFDSINKDNYFWSYIEHLERCIVPSCTHEKVALWINAYNALTVKAIVENLGYLEDSVNDLPTIHADPAESLSHTHSKLIEYWNDPNRIVGKVASQDVTLRDILEVVLSLEPLAIFCLNIGCSQSGPNLLTEAFVASRIQEQIQIQTTDFLSDPKRGVRLEQSQWAWTGFSQPTLYFSRLFLWLDIPTELVSAYLSVDVQKALATGSHARYLEYDWRLNNCQKTVV